MIHYAFKIVMLILLVRNIKGGAAGCKTRRSRYFFICYAISYSVLLLLESVWAMPQVLHFVVLLVLYMGSLRQYYISKKLFKTFLRLWLEILKGIMIYKYPAMEVLCLGLMLISARLIGLFSHMRFEMFRLSRFFQNTLGTSG